MLIQRIGLEIARAAGTDPKADDRFKSVYIDEDGRVTATDGHLWLRMDALTREPDLFVTDRLADLQPMRAEMAILPSDVVQDFVSACKQADAEQIVLCKDDEGKATLATIDGHATRTFLVNPREHALIDFDKVSRHDGQPAVRVCLSIDVLRKLLSTLKACGARTVTMKIWDPASVINIETKSYDADCFANAIVGGIMPMREPDTDTTPQQPSKLPSTADTPEPPPGPLESMMTDAEPKADVTIKNMATGEMVFSGTSDELTELAHRARQKDRAKARTRKTVKPSKQRPAQRRKGGRK